MARDSAVANVATAALWRLVERVAQTIPDEDLMRIAHLGEHPGAKARLKASATMSSAPAANNYSNATNSAYREMIRRGLLTGPQKRISEETGAP